MALSDSRDRNQVWGSPPGKTLLRIQKNKRSPVKRPPRNPESRRSGRFHPLPTSRSSRGSLRYLPSTWSSLLAGKDKSLNQKFLNTPSRLMNAYMKIPQDDQGLFTVAGYVCVLLLLLQLVLGVDVVLD